MKTIKVVLVLAAAVLLADSVMGGSPHERAMKVRRQKAVELAAEHRKLMTPVHGMDFFGEKFERPLKASLHMHSTTSDGAFSPQEVIQIYASALFDVINISDHSKTNAVSKLDHNDILVISGMEMHPKIKRGNTWHLLAINVPEDFPVQDKKSDQEAIDAAVAAGGVVFAAHPYYSGFNAKDIRGLKNISGIEIFNTSTNDIGKGYSNIIWDELIDSPGNPVVNAIAVDDMHNIYNNNYVDIFGGWVMLMCKERTVEAVLDALKKGKYYSTQGPQFKRLSYKDGIFEAEFTPCVSARAIGAKMFSKGFFPTPEEKEITSIRYDLRKMSKMFSSFEWQYVRICITDSQGRSAWSNPVRLDGKNAVQQKGESK